ncbi:hypothetical protein GGR57DRAFT_513620 [Xylariaceae sp. FL1272]|nr:hypothetical protein GGR57DRAFT_513620 [Xylariaceae sp. FL1272]
MSNGPPSDIPLSPWAKRYPDTLAAAYRPAILDGDERHSGYAIEYPWRDAKFYNDFLFHDPVADPEIPLNGSDLHRLFVSEAIQRHLLKGLATWQAAPLNSWVHFGNPTGTVSGGHRTVDSLNDDLKTLWDRNVIDIDESKWFSVFTRRHWYDLRGDATTKLVPEPPDGSFSVDDPGIWDALSISLELADRIYKALIQDCHDVMKTILYGTIMRWKDADPGTEPNPEAVVLLSHAEEVRLAAKHNRPVPNDPFANMSDAQTSFQLTRQFEFLTNGTYWSFIMEKSPGNMRASTMQQGKLVLLNLLFVKNLSNPDLTLAERCHLYFAVAKTIVHELAHVLAFQRLLALGITRFMDPFVDFQEVAEMGEVLESRIFGGKCMVTLHRTNVVRMDTVTRRIWPFMSNIELRNVNVETDQSRWSSVDVDVMDAWDQRHREWTLARNGWYDVERTRWYSSPWGVPNFIHHGIAHFAKAFAEKDFNGCRRAITFVGFNRPGGIQWTSTPFQNELPPLNASGDPNRWYFFAIGEVHPLQTFAFDQRVVPSVAARLIALVWAGLLMTAAIPIHGRDDPPPVISRDPSVVHRYVPSKAYAQQLAEENRTFDPILLTLPQPYGPIYQTPNYYQPFSRTPTRPLAPTQMGHLNVLHTILEYIKQQSAVVSGPWFRKIADMLASIKQQRIQLRIDHPDSHLSRAIDRWDFTPPEYDPQNMDWIRWVPDRQEFENVPGYQPPQDPTRAYGLA